MSVGMAGLLKYFAKNMALLVQKNLKEKQKNLNRFSDILRLNKSNR